jgi:hypothetical protein
MKTAKAVAVRKNVKAEKLTLDNLMPYELELVTGLLEMLQARRDDVEPYLRVLMFPLTQEEYTLIGLSAGIHDSGDIVGYVKGLVVDSAAEDLFALAHRIDDGESKLKVKKVAP